ATNRLKPLYANRSTPLRLYFAVLILLAGAIGVVCMLHSMVPNAVADDRSYSLMAFSIVALTVSLLGALFACEDPILPPHLAREAASFTGRRRFLRVLWPGSGSGAAFSVAVMALFLAGAYLGLRPFVKDFDRGAWAGGPPALPLPARPPLGVSSSPLP